MQVVTKFMLFCGTNCRDPRKSKYLLSARLSTRCAPPLLQDTHWSFRMLALNGTQLPDCSSSSLAAYLLRGTEKACFSPGTEDMLRDTPQCLLAACSPQLETLALLQDGDHHILRQALPSAIGQGVLQHAGHPVLSGAGSRHPQGL